MKQDGVLVTRQWWWLLNITGKTNGTRGSGTAMRGPHNTVGAVYIHPLYFLSCAVFFSLFLLCRFLRSSPTLSLQVPESLRLWLAWWLSLAKYVNLFLNSRARLSMPYPNLCSLPESHPNLTPTHTWLYDQHTTRYQTNTALLNNFALCTILQHLLHLKQYP